MNLMVKLAGLFGSAMHLITVVFICLKLTDQIDWTWLFVLSPSIAAATIGITMMMIGYALIHISHKK